MKKSTEIQNICRQFTHENKDQVCNWAREIGHKHMQSFLAKGDELNPVLILRRESEQTEINIGDWLVVT